VRSVSIRIAFVSWLVLISAAVALADVQWSILNSLKLDSVPRDVAVTFDGQTLYILTEKGDILVYGSDGLFKDKIAIGPHADSLKIDQNGEQLYVISRQNKTIETVKIDFIQEINTEGSPFKGSKDAAVVIAVFSDFQ